MSTSYATRYPGPPSGDEHDPPSTVRMRTSPVAAPSYVPAPSHDLGRLLDHMLKLDASDLYLTAGSPPVFRVNGVGLRARTPLTPGVVDELADQILTPEQRATFDRTCELNFALTRGEGRYRVNVFRQRGATGLVVRLIRTTIRTLDELGCPPILKDIIMSRRGLVLLVGGTGSGKSTALAAMIDHRNTEEAGHIVTVENPIEFIHTHKRSIVTQREVGTDTPSFESALANALRQAPDVILIGEIWDVTTMEAALGFAETGHLCVASLHANNANQAIERVMNFFPSDRHHEIRAQLALNLRAVVSQRLIPTVDGGRAAAFEILLDTPRIKELIKRGEIDVLKDAMEQSTPEGCQTFDASLFRLFAAGRVGEAEALKSADSANNLRLRIDRHHATGGRVVVDDEEPLALLPDVPPPVVAPAHAQTQRAPSMAVSSQRSSRV